MGDTKWNELITFSNNPLTTCWVQVKTHNWRIPGQAKKFLWTHKFILILACSSPAKNLFLFFFGHDIIQQDFFQLNFELRTNNYDIFPQINNNDRDVAEDARFSNSM